MKFIVLIVAFCCTLYCQAQDSLYISKIDSIVEQLERRINFQGINIVFNKIDFQSWDERYFIDTHRKNLLRVDAYCVTIDTMFNGHDPTLPQERVVRNVISYSYYFLENKLIKVVDKISSQHYYK